MEPLSEPIRITESSPIEPPTKPRCPGKARTHPQAFLLVCEDVGELEDAAEHLSRALHAGTEQYGESDLVTFTALTGLAFTEAAGGNAQEALRYFKLSARLQESARGGLVDELWVVLCPIVIGGGKRYLPQGPRLKLELLDGNIFSNGVNVLRYAVMSAGTS